MSPCSGRWEAWQEGQGPIPALTRACTFHMVPSSQLVSAFNPVINALLFTANLTSSYGGWRKQWELYSVSLFLHILHSCLSRFLFSLFSSHFQPLVTSPPPSSSQHPSHFCLLSASFITFLCLLKVSRIKLSL